MKNISRKKFLMNAGLVLTVPGFLEQCASTLHPRLPGKSGTDPLENAIAEGISEPIIKAINVAITAPNPHNTQAWKIRILSPTEILLYVDEKRILPITDPSTRQIHIGQGCFLELFKIGAKQLGFDSEIKILPEGDYKPEEIGKKPVARVKIISGSGQGHALYSSVQSRATNRANYLGELLTDSDIKEILKLGKPEQSELISVLGLELMKPYKEIFYDAMSLETFTYRTNDESRAWFRFSDKEIQSKRDGIALPDQGVTGMTRWMVETFFMSPKPEDFHNKSGLEIFLSRYKEKIESSKAIAYWKTKTNTKKDWIQVGMDYARFQLASTKLGFKLHPFSQALQEYPEMESQRKKLEDLTKVKGNEKVQMIVRMGHSNYQYFTPRRASKEMII